MNIKKETSEKFIHEAKATIENMFTRCGLDINYVIKELNANKIKNGGTLESKINFWNKLNKKIFIGNALFVDNNYHKIWILYCIINNNKLFQYEVVTKDSFSRRLHRHFKSDKRIGKAIREEVGGKDNFKNNFTTFEFYIKNATVLEVEHFEKFIINVSESNIIEEGYNDTYGGDGVNLSSCVSLTDQEKNEICELYQKYNEDKRLYENGIVKLAQYKKVSCEAIKQILIKNGIKLRALGESWGKLKYNEECEVVNLYLKENWNIGKIADHFKVKAKTISGILKKHNIEIVSKRILINTKKEIDDLIYKYTIEKLSLDELAKIFNCNKATIRKRLTKYNIPFIKAQFDESRRLIQKNQEQDIVNLYTIDKLNIKQIAKIYNVSDPLIKAILVKHNVTILVSQTRFKCGERASRIKFTQKQIDEICNLYLKFNSVNKRYDYTPQIIATLYKVSRPVIVRILKKNNIKIRNISEGLRGTPAYNKINFSKTQIDDMCNQYKCGNSIKSVSKAYNVSTVVIKRILLENNITIRARLKIN